MSFKELEVHPTYLYLPDSVEAIIEDIEQGFVRRDYLAHYGLMYGRTINIKELGGASALDITRMIAHDLGRRVFVWQGNFHASPIDVEEIEKQLSDAKGGIFYFRDADISFDKHVLPALEKASYSCLVVIGGRSVKNTEYAFDFTIDSKPIEQKEAVDMLHGYLGAFKVAPEFNYEVAIQNLLIAKVSKANYYEIANAIKHLLIKAVLEHERDNITSPVIISNKHFE